MVIARFMATSLGRSLRVSLGIGLILGGLLGVGGTGGWVLAAFGLVPLVLGSANLCLLAPVLRAPFRGSHVR